MISPSKFTSLVRLKQIQKENYLGEGGQDFCPFEVETLIQEKSNTKGNALVKAAEKFDQQKAERESSDAARWSHVITSKKVMTEMRAAILFSRMGF